MHASSIGRSASAIARSFAERGRRNRISTAGPAAVELLEDEAVHELRHVGIGDWSGA